MLAARFICATASSKWITPALFPNSMLQSPARSEPDWQHETFSLRARRELEDRLCADALESDAVDVNGARRHHRDRRCNIDGHGDWRNSSRFRQKYGGSRRRRALRDAMAMETGGRLVELSRPEKNPDRIRRNDQPHDCGDAEFEPDGRGADIEPDALNQIWRKRSGECFHTWNHVRFHRHIDNRLQGRPLL